MELVRQRLRYLAGCIDNDYVNDLEAIDDSFTSECMLRIN
jgi:hypothetical protein